MFEKDYTFIEALAECYNFHPRKKKESQIVFEITDKDEPGKWFRFGKNWSNLLREWSYFEWEKNCPCLSCEERHFVSNLMAHSFAKTQMIYGAQQGTFQVRKIYDSRIDTKWHTDNEKANMNNEPVYDEYRWCYGAEDALKNVYTFLRFLTDMNMMHLTNRVLDVVDTWDDAETMDQIVDVLEYIGVNNAYEFECLLQEYPMMDSEYSHEAIEKVKEYFKNGNA